jgi:membrane-bound lytic murein transglycosylase D
MLGGKYHGNRNKVLLAYFKSIAYVQKQPDVLDMDLLDSESRDFLIAMQILPVLWEKLNVENSLFAYIELLNGYENLVFEKEVSYYSLSKVLGIKESDMRQGNPVFIGGHIPAMYRDQPFILKKKYFDQYNLLKDSIFSFEEKEKTRLLAQAQKQKKELASNIPPGATEHIYKVRSGDVLGLIAQKYGVKVSDLRNWNNLRGDRINAGQSLVVYRKKGSSRPVEKTEKQIPPETKLDSSPQPGTSYINYDVKPGENLWLIARKFPGVSAENIMNWNDIDKDIKPGQTLKIYR